MMRTVLKLFACLVILAVVYRADARTQQQVGTPLAITSVAIIDVSSVTGEAAVNTDQTVIVRAGRISAVGNSKTTAVPADAQPIDGRGKYLIPGLWDMHAHALNEYEWVFPLFIANGVTGIREMGTVLPFERISEIQRATSEGKLLGPRFGAATARILDGRGSVITPSTVVETADEARRLVREYRQRGMDFIKPYNLLSRDVYLAIVDEVDKHPHLRGDTEKDLPRVKSLNDCGKYDSVRLHAVPTQRFPSVLLVGAVVLALFDL